MLLSNTPTNEILLSFRHVKVFPSVSGSECISSGLFANVVVSVEKGETA
jgi:hypothetical protein